MHKAMPIAIVGVSCRFPKGLENLRILWQALTNRFSAIDTVPEDRWTANRYYSSDIASKGKSYIRRGGFLQQDVSLFDASFFGISPRDAENMDPQQRLLLEVVWEAFENAGLSIPDHAGSNVGVYVGGFMLDHMITQMSAANRSQINQNTAAGMMMTMLSNRISHTFDFRGPSLSIDTACSSSLVAFHYACQDLWRGACDMAVVGGANVMLRPEYPMGMCKGHFLSRDGECKSFDARADGYGRGEGSAAVLLKPLDAAIAAGDLILATVLGTGSNQDGHTPGISMPNGDAQQSLIEQVCREYAIDPSRVSYVECHGTGTAIGDPTEARAIGATYGAARKSANLSPVIIGSIKSNIGHLEAAAGVAALVKAVLTIQHQQTTPLANLQQPNPAIPFDQLGIRLSDEVLPLGESNQQNFCVAINSFGYGGSNAHAVLSVPPKTSQSQAVQTLSPNTQLFPRFLPISARSNKALHSLASKYAELLHHENVCLDDVLYSASFKRAHLSHRAVVSGNSASELIAGLQAVANDAESNRVVRGVQSFQGNRNPVFVFTGMGPQWWAMGQELYRSNLLYRETVDEADCIFQQIAGFSALQEMLREESQSQITRTEFAQPANLLIQIGLLAVLKAAGVVPGAVVGHSVGELGAAYAAGVLSLRDVLTVCFHRSQLQATCAGTGSMLAVALSKEQAAARIAACSDRVSIAAVNGPTNVTLAGDSDELATIAEVLESDGIFHRKLEVEVPYHSPMMDPIMQNLHDALREVRPNAPAIPLYSTVTGARVENISFGADYWPLNIRQSVEFASAIDAILAAGFNLFLEVGPHPVLTTSLQDCAKASQRECRTLHTLRRNKPELECINRSIMSVFAEGGNLDWTKLNASGKFIAIPNYPWQREKYWLENDRAMQDRLAPIVYPILGIQEAPGSPVWRNDFDHEPVAYLRDHVVTGMAILPAAAYMEALLELASIQFEGKACLAIRNLDIHAPMILSVDRGLDCVTSYNPNSQTAIVRSLENGRLGTGQIHVEAKLAGLEHFEKVTIKLEHIAREFTEEKSIDSFYRELNSMGLNYGPAFQTVRQLKLNDDRTKVLSRIEILPELGGDLARYRIHPTLLDACFQSLSAMLGSSDNVYLPTGVAELCVFTNSLPANVWCLGEKTAQTNRFIDCNLTLIDDEGHVLASLRGMRSTAASSRERVDQFGDVVKRQILCYQWQYGETLTEPKRLGHWMVVGSNELSCDVATRLEQYGAIVTRSVSVHHSDAVAPNSQDSICIESTADIKRVLDECGDLDGVVFAHGLDHHDADPTGERAVSALVTCTQGLLSQSSNTRPRVYVLTQSAFQINDSDDSVQPRQSAINGFVRVAFNEVEGLRFSSVDLPAEVNFDVVDAAVLELLCDAPHDEVALRNGLRMTSELVDSPVLSEDQIEYYRVDDRHPVLVRPLRPDVESIGTARIVANNLRQVGDNDVYLEIESSIVPANLLLDPSSDSIDQTALEFVGTIKSIGPGVRDLVVGSRVCGFVPADLASHMIVDRKQLHCVALPEWVEAAKVLSVLSNATRIEHVIERLDLSPASTAVVKYESLGILIAERLSSEGVKVALLADNVDQLAPRVREKFAVYSCCPVGMSQAIAANCRDNAFDVLVADLNAWANQFDFHLVRPGGVVVDTTDCPSSITLPGHVANLVRSDLETLLQRPDRLIKTLMSVVEQISNGTIVALPTLDVTLADLGWQKLPLADTDSTLVLHYTSDGKDLPVVQQRVIEFQKDATYLITGGFGGFGQKTAIWLVQHGAKHLVLTGRTGADTDDRKEFVEQLRALGAVVHAAACDHADKEQLESLFHEIQANMPPLKGVFHSGAVILDQPIGEIDLPTLSKVMQSKALGAWNLHLLTQSMELDHFVLYSSVANLVGNSRQAAYSAANGFLNGLAHYRKSLGLPGLSVNWGAIADVGVVAQDERLEQFLRYTGLRGISSLEGLEVMRQAMACGATQIGVTMITSWADWARFETRGATSPRFAHLIAQDSQSKDNTVRDALIEELNKLEPSDQLELLSSLMTEILASVLKSDPADISADRAISQFGVDSLMATEIQSLFDSKLGISVSILELIGSATIRSVASTALKSLFNEPASATTIPVQLTPA